MAPATDQEKDHGRCDVHVDKTHCVCWWDGLPCCACKWEGGVADEFPPINKDCIYDQENSK